MAAKVIIFDLDGTLIDSASDITNALNFAVQPYTEAFFTVEETKTMIGEGVGALIAKALERKGAVLEKGILLTRFMEFYSAHPADQTLPFDGVRETLEQLTAHRKIVVSNKLEAMSKRILELLGLRDYFDYVAGGDTGPERKPSPRPILDALERFGAKTTEAIIVGDSAYDMEAGRSAGVATVAVLYGYGSPGFERDADFVIRRFSELAAVVENIEKLGADS
jgi:phosphoglycolate phosphatase